MEAFLLFLFVACYLVLCFFLSRMYQRPNYLKILSGIALLLLVWIDNGNAPFGPKLILTGMALSAFWKGYISLKKSKQATL